MASSRYRTAINTDSGTTKPLSLVQQRAKQFEALANSEVKSNKCNWWLPDFRNSREDICECEPCEESRPNDDVSSDKSVNHDDENPVDDVQEEEQVQDKSDDEGSYEELTPSKGNEDSFTQEEENTVDDLPISGTVVEAMNIHFKSMPNTLRGIQLIHSDVEETQATDEE